MGTYKPHEYEAMFYKMKQRNKEIKDELTEAKGAIADLMTLNDENNKRIKELEAFHKQSFVETLLVENSELLHEKKQLEAKLSRYEAVVQAAREFIEAANLMEPWPGEVDTLVEAIAALDEGRK